MRVAPVALCPEADFDKMIEVQEYVSRNERLKDKVEFWSCDCIVKEKVWNGSEKVDHVACSCTARHLSHQNQNKIGPVLVK